MEFDSDSEETNTDDSEQVQAQLPQPKALFIVFWQCLLPLLSRCMICFAKTNIVKCYFNGSLLKAKMLCKNEHTTDWSSQSMVGKITEGNLRIAASILFRY